jgi:DNA-binding transcriptional ArsR family regulator
MNERRELTEREATQVARALADPTRLSILRTLLQHGELSCGELAERFPIAQSTVSHHLNTLMQAELVAMRKQGQHHYFRPCATPCAPSHAGSPRWIRPSARKSHCEEVGYA